MRGFRWSFSSLTLQRITLVAIGVALSLAGCDGLAGSTGAPDESSARIRVAVLPDEAEAVLRLRYEPLLGYLAPATGFEFELTVPASYEALLAGFQADAFDLVWFGGLTFTRAHARSGAEPLVMREIDLQFTSDFLVRAARTEQSIDAFRGASFAFGPRLSTSGHLMPRAFLGQRGIDPEKFFGEIRYSSGHDETARWVRDGVVALGVANSVIVEGLGRRNSTMLKGVRILDTTDPFSDYVWATRPGLPLSVREALLIAFLQLDRVEPDHAVILETLDASGYLPASAEDFRTLYRVAASQGLLEETP